jgi:NAD(P)-dependent dehydrogenase (short-subunit alcohol dehydrogenase family)
MRDFLDKVAVITGGGSGIGLATGRALAAQGCRLVLADIEEGALKRAADEFARDGVRVVGVRTDVGDRSSVAALAEKSWSAFGRVDILFNNAGVAVFGPTQSMTHADWEWSIRVNLWGPIHGVEAFVPRMVADKHGGHILFTASFAGLVPNRELGPYCVTKFGVVALAECLQKDLRADGIGVSVLCPMRVTSRIDDSFRNRPSELGGPSANRTYTEEERAALQGRELGASEVADLVVDAVRENRFYIHTHSEARQYVKRRWERLDAAFEDAL